MVHWGVKVFTSFRIQTDLEHTLINIVGIKIRDFWTFITLNESYYLPWLDTI